MDYKTTNNKNAVIYCRVSTEDQGNIPSLEMQEQICREFCENDGWKLDKVFIDKTVSPFSSNNSQLIEALSYCIKNHSKIWMFIVWGWDHRAWERGEYLACKMLLATHNIRFESASFDDHPESELMDDIISSMMEYEHKITALRMKSAVERARESVNLVGPAPEGYIYCKNTDGTDIPTIDLERGDIITEAFEMYSEGTFSIREIVDHINNLGFRTRRKSEQISIQSLIKILRNRIYVGEVFVNEVVGYVPTDFAPLVSRDVFDDVQKLLNDREYLLARDHQEWELSSKFHMQII